MAELKNEFSWSVSRDRLFRSCPRAYYYNYYGSWGGWDRNAPERTRRIYILKNLQTLEMWAGGIVHDTIAEVLRRYARARAPIRAGELQARARAKLRQGWVEAVSGAWRQSPKKTNLYGLYYGNGKTLPRERTERIRERVYSCLAAFAESDVLREVLAVPYMSWRPVDQLDSFALDGLKVWCAIDFAYTDPGGVLRILDWKTGGENAEELELQLACYAYFAQEKWYTHADNLRAAGVYLRDGARVREHAVTPEVLVRAKETILDSAARMREKLTDVSKNAAREQDFPFSADERACNRCNFREVCPREKDTEPVA